ncbi:glycerate kinase [Acetobacterium paludosum]|uniref:glycerate kinase n=1 Tax=Acetobacterium paludosum TaxID=52693 RepID=UPI00197AA90A|nr:glycerate kinase [Acetobacterium paludosum]
MRIVIAPDSFKGSLSAAEVCNIAESAILKIMPTTEIIKISISDGGESLVDVLVKHRSGEIVKIKAKDPLFREIMVEYGILNGEIAVIEMATASGLPLLNSDERNPLITSTYGTGEMIVDAVINRGFRKIILGISGGVRSSERCRSDHHRRGKNRCSKCDGKSDFRGWQARKETAYSDHRNFRRSGRRV